MNEVERWNDEKMNEVRGFWVNICDNECGGLNPEVLWSPIFSPIIFPTFPSEENAAPVLGYDEDHVLLDQLQIPVDVPHPFMEPKFDFKTATAKVVCNIHVFSMFLSTY